MLFVSYQNYMSMFTYEIGASLKSVRQNLSILAKLALENIKYKEKAQG